jgi:hypothetical protein
VNGALSPSKTASLFGNNIWIMTCTWLHNMSTCSLTVIRPWRVIMGPTEYGTMILLPKQSQYIPSVSLLGPCLPGCTLPSVFSKRKLFLTWGTAWRTTHLIIWRERFQSSDAKYLRSWHHRLRISTLLSVIRGLAIAALPWVMDLWSSRRTVFGETESSTCIFSSAVLSSVPQ